MLRLLAAVSVSVTDAYSGKCLSDTSFSTVEEAIANYRAIRDELSPRGLYNVNINTQIRVVD